MFRDFPTFSRICIFFLLTLSLLWSSLFYSSLLSDSSHLCFSSVHIVGSLTSKLPSIIFGSAMLCPILSPSLSRLTPMSPAAHLPWLHISRPTIVGPCPAKLPHSQSWHSVSIQRWPPFRLWYIISKRVSKLHPMKHHGTSWNHKKKCKNNVLGGSHLYRHSLALVPRAFLPSPRL